LQLTILDEEILEQAEIQVKYSGYIDKERECG
jgi:tRNA U34 5-carboxymethylaminomethyl modifying enzyme MnmG/GidA